MAQKTWGKWVYAERGFDTLPATLCPGIIGKQPAMQLKELDGQLWKMRASLVIATAFPNKICLPAASLSWGGHGTCPAWAIGEQEPHPWTPSELGNSKAPSDWALGKRKPRSAIVEVWGKNAINRSYLFSLLYGNQSGSDAPRLGPRREAVGK